MYEPSTVEVLDHVLKNEGKFKSVDDAKENLIEKELARLKAEAEAKARREEARRVAKTKALDQFIDEHLNKTLFLHIDHVRIKRLKGEPLCSAGKPVPRAVGALREIAENMMAGRVVSAPLSRLDVVRCPCGSNHAVLVQAIAGD